MATSESVQEMPAWARPLIRALQLPDRTNPEEVLERASIAADRLAPDTRRLWRLILLAEGAAVLAPVTWLLVVRLGWPMSYAAYAVAFCTLMVVGICWWLRWKGAQQTWARARLLAEIARSAKATAGIAPGATTAALAGSPSLQPLAEWIAGDAIAPAISPDQARQNYISSRIDDQLDYYRKKNRQAGEERRRLSRHVTRSLDGALFLAVAGVALSMSHTGERWLRLSGSDYVLGVVGTALPLIAILMQSLGSYLELNRRAGRYAQQVEFLESIKAKSEATATAEQINVTVCGVERELLSEVVEWFYQAQHTEPYYRSKSRNPDAMEIREALAVSKQSWSRKSMVWLGISAGFVGRVVLGRVLVGALSVVLTTAFIAFYIPKDSEELSRLRLEDGRLLSSPQASGWQPMPERAEKGFILIAHGLHDGVNSTGKTRDGKPHWMTRMQDTLNATLKSDTPEICLVDWRLAAIPAVFSGTGAGGTTTDADRESSIPIPPEAWLQDVAAIRPQAEEIGELVGFKLARAIRQGDLRQDRPMHFIGHSAGGFVVLHAALVLKQLGLAPGNFRVTMLDTPLPVVADLKLLAADIPLDFYCTSALATGIPDSGFAKSFTRFDITPPVGIDPYTGAHSYAHEWYIDTMSNRSDKGFAFSPFALRH